MDGSPARSAKKTTGATNAAAARPALNAALGARRGRWLSGSPVTGRHCAAGWLLSTQVDRAESDDGWVLDYWVARLRGIGPLDPGLLGAWTPDPVEPDFPYIMSYVFDRWWVWTIGMGPPLWRAAHGYRVVGHGRLAVGRFGIDGVRRYRLDGPDVLVLGRYRFLRTTDPEDRPWFRVGEEPPAVTRPENGALGGAVPNAVQRMLRAPAALGSSGPLQTPSGERGQTAVACGSTAASTMTRAATAEATTASAADARHRWATQ